MAQNKGTALQDPFLNALRKERIPVSIYLAPLIKWYTSTRYPLWCRQKRFALSSTLS